MNIVWVVCFYNESGFYTFSSAEKAYNFLYKMIDDYGFDPNMTDALQDELNEDYEEFGVSGYSFGAEGYGYAEPTIVDEED